MAALQEGVIDAHTTCHCQGHHDLNGHRFHCWNWKVGGHGSLNVKQALERSCDVFFYQVALKLGAEKISHYAKMLGYGDVTHIDLPGEKKGLVPDPQWKVSKKRGKWSAGDTLNLSIGQGFMLSTPLQNAKMLAMIANGMQPLTPHLVEGSAPPNTSDALNTDVPFIAQSYIDLILEGLYDVVNTPTGTAYNARPLNPHHTMSGKTASTQVSRISMQQRQAGTHNQREWAHKEHAMFAGLVPALNPQYVISVLVEHGGGGARVAAPISRDIAQALYKLKIVSDV